MNRLSLSERRRSITRRCSNVPMFDHQCKACSFVFEALGKYDEHPPCPECGSETERVWTKAPFTVPDDVPGGFQIHNLDAHPRTFYSRSAYRDELRARGLQIRDRHMGAPGEGSDKAPLMRDPQTGRMTRPTSRWI